MNEKTRKIIFFDELDSTNTYAKSAPNLEDGALVIAKRQSSGHGRMGRAFVSEEGGVYLSLVKKPALNASELAPLTGMSAVAVSNAVERVCGARPYIRWTNDLLFSGKKVCGILAENVFAGQNIPERVVIGVGINVCQRPESFSECLSASAGTLDALLGKKTDAAELALAVADELDLASDILNEGDRKKINEYLKKYRASCVTLGKKVSVLLPSLCNEADPREVFAKTPDLFPKACALDINDTFGLIIRYENGKEDVLRSGEVSVRESI